MADYIMENWMDMAGAVLGLLYLYLEMKENVWMWITGLVMPAVYIVVLYRAGIYADCGMEAYYFFAGIYGLWYWLRGGRGAGKPAVISKVPRRLGGMLCLYALLLWIILGIFLDRCTDSTVPYIDGFTTALSVIALWMLSRKYIEQWWVWFVVDLISTGLYVYKGIYGRSLLYGIYTCMAVYGYFVWKKKADERMSA